MNFTDVHLWVNGGLRRVTATAAYMQRAGQLLTVYRQQLGEGLRTQFGEGLGEAFGEGLGEGFGEGFDSPTTWGRPWGRPLKIGPL